MTTLSGRSRVFRVLYCLQRLRSPVSSPHPCFSIALQHAPPSTTIDDAWREQPKCPDPSPDQVLGRPVDLGKFSAKGGNKRMSGRASWWTLRRMKLPLSRFAYPDSSPRLSPAMLCPVSLDYRPRAEGHPDSWRRALTCAHTEGYHEGEFCKIGSRKKKSTEQQRHGRGRGAALMRDTVRALTSGVRAGLSSYREPVRVAFPTTLSASHCTRYANAFGSSENTGTWGTPGPVWSQRRPGRG